MTVFEDQRDYWDRAATTKAFTHPLDLGLLKRYVSKTATVLDYGCGQGRLCKELVEDGFENVLGVDFSSNMVARARSAVPRVPFSALPDTGSRCPRRPSTASSFLRCLHASPMIGCRLGLPLTSRERCALVESFT
jgi:SAM-dependent methyltransferase